MTSSELKEFLDFKASHYESAEFITSDPISIPHQFVRKEDIEISAFLIATIAWGNRKSIITNGKKLMNIMGNSPYEFVMHGNFSDLKFVHRTFNAEDLRFFLSRLKEIYSNGGLENSFSPQCDQPAMYDRLVYFRSIFIGQNHTFRSGKHISDPSKNSACKRINMFLRWMVRSNTNGVDFGIWHSISPSELLLPLDVHTGNNARRLGLLTRQQNDWKAITEVMIQLRAMDPLDPVKYDFALFGLGAFEGF